MDPDVVEQNSSLTSSVMSSPLPCMDEELVNTSAGLPSGSGPSRVPPTTLMECEVFSDGKSLRSRNAVLSTKPPDSSLSCSLQKNEDSPALDIRGRPSHDICHTKAQKTLFSHLNHKINLKGLMNLLCIIVVAQNARLVLENLLKYGKFPVTRLLYNNLRSVKDFTNLVVRNKNHSIRCYYLHL